MKEEHKSSQSIDNQLFEKDYSDIMNSSDTTSVIINTEWTKNGDYFQKFSMYDSGYTPVKTLGDTTLINCL